MNYYNDFDKYTSRWLWNLIKAEKLPYGYVDQRSILEVKPDDVYGYKQCHFFAGIGGWPLALQLAGISPDESLWTGSCPCQPFSSAGKQKGKEDERHLWPAWFRLIRECKPKRIFGEQVANAIGHGWLDGISADLEAEGYTVGAVVLGAHSIGAPHIRQRLFWVANSDEAGRVRPGSAQSKERGSDIEFIGRSENLRMADSESAERRPVAERSNIGECGEANGDLAHPERNGRNERGAECERQQGRLASFWSGATLIPCGDGKARPIEPGLSPLVNGVSGRVVMVRTRKQGDAEIKETHSYSRIGALKGFGNAIVPQLAAEFIRVVEEARAH